MTNTQLAPVATAHLTHADSRQAFRTVRMLTGGYLALSVLTIVAIALLRNHAALVNSAVWIRGTIVMVSSAFTFAFGARAARGSRGAYRRLRIIAAVMVAAITVIIALPGTFPMWMKLEQAVCGLLLLGVVAVVNGRQLRSVFATA
ncbi:hypothetical protein [Rugosimonospora africana]|nr:hypothetical protein [Rugosimonospora africana]